MVMVHEYMVKEYRNGNVLDIRNYDFKFNEWLWDVICRVVPLELIQKPIDVGLTNGASFWAPIDFQQVRQIGFTVGIKRSRFSNTSWRVPIYKRVKIEPSNFVFCVDQLNNLSNEEKVINTLENLMEYSKKYIITSCWAFDIKIPAEIECRKRYYWNFEEYLPRFKAKRFNLIAKAVYKDAINIAYVLKKEF